MDQVEIQKNPVLLASAANCSTWTADARQLFQKGARPWKGVLQAPVVALQQFHQQSGAAMTLYVATHLWTTSQQRQGTLVSLYFATEAVVSREQLDGLGKPLAGIAGGWSYDGVHAAPDYAFPCLHAENGRVDQVWESGPEGPFSRVLSARGAHARVEELAWNDAESSRYVAQCGHALGEAPTLLHGDRQLREQLKLAYAYRVAERVIEADGQVVDDERAFLMRAFPAEQLEELWLDDLGLRDQLAERAESELKDLLGYHEKLGLLSTFFGACYADGTLAVQELQVLKEASAALGLDRSEVVNYLHKLW